jgi:hypothetical protein
MNVLTRCFFSLARRVSSAEFDAGAAARRVTVVLTDGSTVVDDPTDALQQL